MAEEGGGFENNPSCDPGDDWSNDDDDTGSGDKTTPFLPFSAFTPGVQKKFQCNQCSTKKTGLQDTYVETSFRAPTLSERAWVAEKDLFRNMSSSKLGVSYNSKGRLQVKTFGAGKKLYDVITTEKSTGLDQINKNLPKEIKTALGTSKYENVQKTINEK